VKKTSSIHFVYHWQIFTRHVSSFIYNRYLLFPEISNKRDDFSLSANGNFSRKRIKKRDTFIYSHILHSWNLHQWHVHFYNVEVRQKPFLVLCGRAELRFKSARVPLNSDKATGFGALWKLRCELIRPVNEAANIFYSIKRDIYAYTNLLQNLAKLFDRKGIAAAIDIPISFFMSHEYVYEYVYD